MSEFHVIEWLLAPNKFLQKYLQINLRVFSNTKSGLYFNSTRNPNGNCSYRLLSCLEQFF